MRAFAQTKKEGRASLFFPFALTCSSSCFRRTGRKE